MKRPPHATIERDVRTALTEDVGRGDVTAELIPADQTATARVISRENAIFCGRPWFDETFAQIDQSVEIDWHVSDGDSLEPDSLLCEIRGNARAILTAERTALNFVQLLSAVATVSRRYSDAISHTDARILDTRKTIPGLRLAQKYAVRCGGAHNHRIGLYDAFLIKENHIVAAGSIKAAIGQARTIASGLLIEVEVETIEQMELAIAAGAERVMLDNFNLQQTRDAVEQNAGRVQLEASGNLNMDTIAAVAETGVDYLSIGALTKHIRAVDLSMRFSADKSD